MALERARAALAEVQRHMRGLSRSFLRRLLLGSRSGLIDGLDDPRLLEPERMELRAILRRLLDEGERGGWARAIVVGFDEAKHLFRFLRPRFARLNLDAAASLYLLALISVGLAAALANTAKVGHVLEPVAITWRLPGGAVEQNVLRAGEAIVFQRERGLLKLRRWRAAQGYDYTEVRPDESR